jgi:hypothetical protein
MVELFLRGVIVRGRRAPSTVLSRKILCGSNEKMMVDKKNGYVYAVCGDELYLREAVTSIRSLKAVDEAAHATLITTPSLAASGQPIEAFDRCVEVQDERVDGNDVNWQTGLSFKASVLYEYSPYDRSFFVDSDTYFVDDCGGLFDLLNHFDLCLAKAPRKGQPYEVNGSVLEGYESYNSGVILFRKGARVEDLFRQWEENFEHGTFWGDQRALTDTLVSASVAPYVLPNNWNARFRLGSTRAACTCYTGVTRI